MANRSPFPPPPPPPSTSQIRSPNSNHSQASMVHNKSHTQGNFHIATTKEPISKAAEIDALTEQIGIPMPEMIFGANHVSITHVPSRWKLEFTTPGALDAVDKTDKKMLKVAYARDWESTREGTTQKIKEVVKPYDWSYSTEYRGTVVGADAGAGGDTANTSRAAFQESKTAVIPIELLKRKDPILFFDEVMLYESELDDNGTSSYSAKMRVHEKRMLLLVRLFMRLDNVLLRIRDTRIYIDFDTDQVIREYTAKEATSEGVKRKLYMQGRLPDDIVIAMRDPNVIDPLLELVEQTVEVADLR